jgi:hypothetical protein
MAPRAGSHVDVAGGLASQGLAYAADVATLKQLRDLPPPLDGMR